MAETLAASRRRGRSALPRVRRDPQSDTISFGQALVPEVIDRAIEVASNAT